MPNSAKEKDNCMKDITHIRSGSGYEMINRSVKLKKRICVGEGGQEEK